MIFNRLAREPQLFPPALEGAMVQLYYYPGNASLTPHILLEEIGTPFELLLVDRTNGAHRSPQYLKLNPNGQIPVLVEGDFVLYETAAICLHLADTRPQARLAPPMQTAERAHFYKWLVWCSNTIPMRSCYAAGPAASRVLRAAYPRSDPICSACSRGRLCSVRSRPRDCSRRSFEPEPGAAPPTATGGCTCADGWIRAAFQNTIFYIPRDEDDGVGVWADLSTTVESLATCYTISYVPASSGGNWGSYFFFGGPSGTTCN
jgi:hypothetical protein